jgi:Trypsin
VRVLRDACSAKDRVRVGASGGEQERVGGTADNGTHANVGVFFIDDRPALVVGFCSGSLISAHEFLTAGHCTSALLPARIEHYRVSFDDQLSLSPEGFIAPGNSVAVAGWTTHPDYNFPHNDVGVIHLAQDVTGVTPIELPGARLSPHPSAWTCARFGSCSTRRRASRAKKSSSSPTRCTS